MSEYVCKHCGSDDIVATIEVSYSTEIPGRIREGRDGKPRFDESRGHDFDDFDIVEYVCECSMSHWKLEGLVIRRQAFDQLRRPCGRCDHGATAHRLLGGQPREGFTRQPMPCTVAGCDCHDYYDLAIETAIPANQMELAA